MDNHPSGVFIFIFLLFLARVVTTLVHELGHAIAVLLLTRAKVDVYVGAIGDMDNAFHLNLGRLRLWFKFRPFDVNNGFNLSSTEEEDIPTWKQYVFISSGLLATLIIMLLCIGVLRLGGFNKMVDYAATALLVSATIDLVRNIFFYKYQLLILEYGIVSSDVFHLMRLCSYHKHLKKHIAAVEAYNTGLVDQALQGLKSLTNTLFYKVHAIRSIAGIYFVINEYEKALLTYKKLDRYYFYEAEDYDFIGQCHGHLNQNDEALEAFEKSLQLDPENISALQNKAYTLILTHSCPEAIALFNQILEKEPKNTYAMSNRGWAKLKMGNQEEGLKDIEDALKIDPDEPFAHRNLGWYWLEKGEKAKAVHHLQQSLTLNEQIHLGKAMLVQAVG